MTSATPKEPPRRSRVWLALFVPPLVLAAVFAAFAAYLALGRGVPPGELAKTLERAAALPASIGFTAVFFIIRALAARDGLTLRDLGWLRPGLADVAIGLGAAAALWAANTWLLYPLLQAAQPSFEPTLKNVSAPLAVLMLALAVTAEETIYRGYALEVLRQRHGTAVALGVTTACYALLAPGPELPLKLWAAYFGLVMGALKLWRRNLWPVAIAHGLVSLGPKLLSLA